MTDRSDGSIKVFSQQHLFNLLFEIPDWETFEQRFKELRPKYAKESSPLLFRGQGNSDWPLTTTLERSCARRMLFRKYYELICASMGPRLKAEFRDRSNQRWIVQRWGYLTPAQARRQLLALGAAA